MRAVKHTFPYQKKNIHGLKSLWACGPPGKTSTKNRALLAPIIVMPHVGTPCIRMSRAQLPIAPRISYLPSSTGQPSGAEANQPNPRAGGTRTPLPIRVHVLCPLPLRPHLPSCISLPLLPPPPVIPLPARTSRYPGAKAPKGKMVSPGRHRTSQQPWCPVSHSTAGDASHEGCADKAMTRGPEVQ